MLDVIGGEGRRTVSVQDSILWREMAERRAEEVDTIKFSPIT